MVIYVLLNNKGAIEGWGTSKPNEDAIKIEIEDDHPFIEDNPEKYLYVDGEIVLREDADQVDLEIQKRDDHQEKKQIAEKLIMDRMVTDYILSTELTDEEKDMFINLFDLWEPNTAYSRGDKLVYEGLAYEVIQAHTSQSDWLPSELPALYKMFYQTSTDDGTVVIPEWKQPLGAHDAYNTGDLVFHDGQAWESDVDGNIWEPGVYGWSKVEVD